MADNALPLEQPTYCTVCGRPLGIFPEDQPDWPTGALCGECYQSNQMEDEVLYDDLYGEER